MIIEVYVMDELDKLDDWIQKILTGNKVMEGLHKEIYWIKDKAQEQLLEVEKYYNSVCLHIFKDESKNNLLQCHQYSNSLEGHLKKLHQKMT